MVELDPTPRPIDALPGMGAPEDVALEDRNGTLTYAELEAAVAAMAGWLQAQGLSPGARVATWLPASPNGGVFARPVRVGDPSLALILPGVFKEEFTGVGMSLVFSGRAPLSITSPAFAESHPSAIRPPRARISACRPTRVTP